MPLVRVGSLRQCSKNKKMKSGTSQLAKGAVSQSRSRDALLHDFKRPI